MRKHFLGSDNNLLLNNFVVTLIIVFISLIIASRLIYISFHQFYIDNVRNEKSKEMEAVTDRLCQELNNLDNIAYSLLSNNKTAGHKINRGGYSGIIATREILNHQIGKLFIDEILLYTWHDDQHLITSASSICDIDTMLIHRYGYPMYSREVIDDILSLNYAPILFTSDDLIDKSSNRIRDPNYKNRIFYAVPSSAPSIPLNSSILFVLCESALQDIFNQLMSNYNGYIFLLDSENDAVISFQRDELPMDSKALLSLLDFNYHSIDGQTLDLQDMTYNVFYEELRGHPYSLALIIPALQHLTPLTEWIDSLAITLISLLVTGLFLALLITIANYFPIYRFTHIVKSLTALKQDPSIGRELPYISNALISLSNQNVNLMERIQDLSTIHNREFLINLFNGNYLDSNISAQLSTTSIVLDKPAFIVLCITIDDFQQFQQDHSKDMQLILKECILTHCERCLSDIGNAYGVEIRQAGMYAVLLNIKADDLKENSLNLLSENLISYINKSFELSLTIGTSLIYFHLSDTPTAFAQARVALDFRLIYGSSKVIPYNDNIVNSTNADWYPVRLERQLLDAIHILDIEEISNIISHMMTEFHEQNLTAKKIEFICCSIIGTLISFMAYLDIEADSEFYELQLLFTHFQFETLDIIEHHLNELILIVCKSICKGQFHRVSSLTDQILEYIDDNYNDHTLCLQSIAEHFHYSVSYISRLFKEDTGYTLINYLDNIRMQHSKQLLRETDYSLTQILEQVGYNDKNNFVRKFRQLEDITPMQYRNNYQTRIINILNGNM